MRVPRSVSPAVLIGSGSEIIREPEAAVIDHLAEPTVSENASPVDHAAAAVGGRNRRAPGPDPEATLKQLAKTLARDATARIGDRHLRALVRTDCYNQVVTLLRHIDQRRQSLLERQRRTRLVLGSTVLALAVALSLSLMF